MGKWENDGKTMGNLWFSMGFDVIYTLVMTNVTIEHGH